MLDFHGYMSNAQSQENDSRFIEVADTDKDPFIVVTPNGMSDNEYGFGSWNCSKTVGPKGPTCDRNRGAYEYGTIICCDSCPECDPNYSCDFASCYDDVYFTRKIVDYVSTNFCLDQASVHHSGISNGGLFSYYMISQLADIFASIAPVAASPLNGYGEVPSQPVSLFDIHGVNDDVIPIDLDHAEREGPENTLVSYDGFYYMAKNDTITSWVTESGCSGIIFLDNIM